MDDCRFYPDLHWQTPTVPKYVKLLYSVDREYKIVAITADEVRRIAHLARLGVDESRLEGYADELSSVLGLVEQMDNAEVGGAADSAEVGAGTGAVSKDVEPMAHPAHAIQRLRDDEVSETDQRDQLQSCAPLVDKGLFLVPKVIE